MAREALRETLIGIALSMLEKGVEDLGLRAIAREAGVSAMAPYRHFADYKALLDAVSERGFAMLHEALLAADRSADACDALLSQGEAYLAFARGNPALFRLMFSGGQGRWKQRGGDGPARSEGAYDVMSRRAGNLVPESAAAAALSCWSVVHGLATLALDGRLAGMGPDLERDSLRLFIMALAKARAP